MLLSLNQQEVTMMTMKKKATRLKAKTGKKLKAKAKVWKKKTTKK